MVDPRLAGLAHAYLDGHLAADGVPELERALLEDAAFRAWFADLHRRETALRTVLVQVGQAEILSAASRRVHPPRFRRFGRPRSIDVLPYALAALLLLGLGALGLMRTWHDAPTGVATVVAKAQGDRQEEGAPLAVGTALPAGARLHLGPSALLRFAAGAMLEVDAASALVLRDDGCDLTAGAIDLEVDPQPAQRPFRITTPQAVLTVVGTRFSVTITDQGTRLAVGEGIVDMRTAAWTRRLTAGQTASFPEPERPAAGAPPVPAMPPGGVLAASLCDATTDLPVPGCDPLVDGAVVERARLTTGCAGLRFRTASGVVGVTTTVTGPSSGRPLEPMELKLPFTYPRDRQGDIDESWRLEPGSYQVVAQGYADAAGQRRAGPPLTLRFTVVDRR